MGWLAEMSGFVKGVAPQQLVLSGTEGFFVPQSGGDHYLLNPGAWGAGQAAVGWLACAVAAPAMTAGPGELTVLQLS